eukprot:3822584-Rhodomonas_salina.1
MELVAQYHYDPVKGDELKYKQQTYLKPGGLLCILCYDVDLHQTEQAGDRILQLEPPRRDGWFRGRLGGKKGWVDSGNMEKPPNSPAATSDKTLSSGNAQSTSSGVEKTPASPAKQADTPRE